MAFGSFLRGRIMKVLTAVAIVMTLSVLDSEYTANNNNIVLATEMPTACCFTLPYSCGVAEDMAFLVEVSFALSDIADSRPSARWYAKHSGGDALSMLLIDARSRETVGSAFNNVTVLAIAEEEANGMMLRPDCTGIDCKAAPSPPRCAKLSLDAGCRWQELTKGKMDGIISEAMAMLAEADVSDEEIEDAMLSLKHAAKDIQRIADALQSGSIETWLEQAWRVAIYVGSELSASLARVACDISMLLAEGPSTLDVACQSLDFIGEHAANCGLDVFFDYSRDVVWAAYEAVHKKFSRATAAAAAASAGTKKGEVEMAGGAAAATVQGSFARRIAESFRRMQQQALEDAPPAGSIEHHLLYDPWI